MFSIFVCLFRLSAVVHSEIFWGLAERRWTQEPDWRTSIRWPSTDRWVVTSMSWWVKVISALSSSPSSSLLSSPPQVGFDSIGGLWGHISALKEMVVFPLLYPEVFDNFKIQPPRFIYYIYIHMCIYYTSSLFYTLLDQYQELSIKHHQFIDVWGQYFYFFYFVIVKDKYLFCAAAVKRLKTPEMQQLNDCFD